MKILWITNIIFPAPCKELCIESPVIGGWMLSLAKVLISNMTGLNLAVATVYGGDKLRKIEIEDITYYLLPLKGDKTKYQKALEGLWKEVNAEFCPDIVHIHGTEFPHGLAFVKANPEVKVVASIQGLVSVYDRYYLGCISFGDILRNITIRDILRGDNLWQAQRKFANRGRYERELIGRIKHIIGRTSWDKAQVWAINPDAEYHFCNETLRKEFYEHKWNYDDCERHSIFISQAGYPIKGLHQVLSALPWVLKEYPDTKVYIAGGDITRSLTFKEKMRLGGYGKFIKHLIKKFHLEDKIIFTGALTEKEMCSRYLKSNLFICSSSIENSPNSLGEAQMLGVPCLASYVGGAMDMMKGYEDFLYRFEEVEMLAMKVCEIFCQGKEVETFDREIALKRHDGIRNTKTLMRIYDEIIEKDNNL